LLDHLRKQRIGCIHLTLGDEYELVLTVVLRAERADILFETVLESFAGHNDDCLWLIAMAAMQSGAQSVSRKPQRPGQSRKTLRDKD